jgi:hypothetical protein
MSGDLLLPFVEAIARNTELSGDLGGRALAGVEQLDCVSFKLGRKPSSLCHLTPPWGRIVPPFEVSVKPGLAQDMWNVTTQVFRLKAEVGFYDLGFKQR